MSQTQNPSQSGARNSGRRRNRNNRRPSHGGQHSGSHSHGIGRSAAPKKSAFQKLLGFFGFGKKTPAARPPRPVNPGAPQGQGKVTRESIPNRNPREKREGGQRSQARKPENVEVTNPRLYIGNLSYDATENDLQEVFNGVGRVNSVEIVTNSRTQRSKGYGFVEMGSIEEAKRAVETLHDQEFMGRKLVVSGAKPKEATDIEA